MQGGIRQPAASAGQVGYDRRYSRVGVLLLGLAVSACASGAQLENLSQAPRGTIAFESIDGPPPAVSHKFVSNLKEEAGARRIAVVPPGEANYRLRGYLAAHEDQAGSAGTSISWALDAYDSNQRRAFRLSGEEKTTGRMWAAADDQLLQKIARAGMEKFVVLSATARPTSRSAATAAPPPQRTTSTALGWLDDWAPEASGIFRILRREPARGPEIAADAGPQLPPDEVPLPRGRPAPSSGTPGSALAFGPDDE
jgi:hypothetical protein